MTTHEVLTSELRTELPFRSLFGRSQGLVDRLAESIRRNGYDPAFPIVTWNLVVVDGHQRLAAAKAAKVRRVWCVPLEFGSEEEALEYAIRCQRDRRNLTDAEIASALEVVDKRKTAGRPAAELASHEANSGKSADATAALLGTSRAKVEKCRTIMEHDPALWRAVKAGKATINGACRKLRAGGSGSTADGKDAGPLPDTPEPARIEKWHHNLRCIAEKFPPRWWHCIADCMRNVAAELDMEATDPLREDAV